MNKLNLLMVLLVAAVAAMYGCMLMISSGIKLVLSQFLYSGLGAMIFAVLSQIISEIIYFKYKK